MKKNSRKNNKFLGKLEKKILRKLEKILEKKKNYENSKKII